MLQRVEELNKALSVQREENTKHVADLIFNHEREVELIKHNHKLELERLAADIKNSIDTEKAKIVVENTGLKIENREVKKESERD